MNKKPTCILICMLLFITVLLPIGEAMNGSKIDGVNPRGSLDIDWWPMFRHDSEHMGFSTSTAPDTNQVLWSYQTDFFISSSPAVSHGKVYIGSWDNKIYCFDMNNGDMLWNYTTNGEITSSPAVADGKVYIGSKDSKMYCLDAIDGSLIWDYDTIFMVESSPVVKDGNVYFGSSDGALYCLNADDGSLIWSYPTGNVIWSSPVVLDNKVYFGSLDGVLFCLDSTDGDLVWTYTTSSGIWSTPTVSNGKVFFGSNDNNVYCLNAEDGSFIWSYDTLGEVHSSPALAYGYVYIGSSDRGLFCLNEETGEHIWDYLTNGGIWSHPSVADGKVYFGTYPCCGAPSYLACFDALDGDEIWQYHLGTELGMKSSPAIAAGKVFIGSGDGKVIAFGEDELIADANGPYYGFVNMPIQYTGSAYGGIPSYSWFWDFGDGNTSDEQNPIHTYINTGNYTVTLTVTDNENSISTDITQAYIEIPNMPPDKPTITGQTNGNAGKEYKYIITGSDLDGDDIYVIIDWGDNTSSGWLGPYTGNYEISAKHIWDKEGTYTIKAKAKDIYGVESEWGTLEVTMPVNQQFSNVLRNLERIFSHFPVLEKLLLIFIQLFFVKT